ncbi:acyl--CoA ligase [Phanerochaete sordida]|uniref:Acyl--CoA ligase n=1 Tax=Phanerochaete sordida TaxID=48140 RepID=A0A9P3LJV5_9APHY|nr:acyl--CoA ligase [Phanerochaete sordida]
MSTQLSHFESCYPPVPLTRSSYYTFVLGRDIYAPEHPFTINGQTGHVTTRRALREDSLRLAHGLRNAHRAGLAPLRRGSVAMLLSPSTDLYVVVQFAMAAAGVTCVLANPAFSPGELAHALDVSDASHVFAHPSAVPLVHATLRARGLAERDIRQRVVLLAPDGEVPHELRTAGWVGLDRLDTTPVLGVPERFDGDEADATALIYFSSGTTGLSKGVELSHANLVANITLLSAVYMYNANNDDVTITGVPLFHVLGGLYLVMFSLFKGVPVVLLPRFVPAEYLACVQKYKVTTIITAPPVLLFLTNDPLVDQFDLSSLRILGVGAAPVSAELVHACKARFAARGWHLNIGQGYGMTEICGVCTYVPYEEMAARPTSIGRIFPNCAVRVVDADARPVPVGQPGELWIRSPAVMKGYAKNPTATAATITPDGWLRTGDVAVADAGGYLQITDRIKELIKYKGFQVAPAELENILSSHPDVADCAVIGVYSKEEATELPKAYIVPRDPKYLSSPAASDDLVKSIHAWLAPRVSSYKRLRGGIALTHEIPKSVSGKILKRKLREQEETKQPAAAKL